METTVTKKFWQGTNFWVALALLVAGLWTSFTTETGDIIANAITGVPAVVFALRQLVKTGVIDFPTWLDSKNTWNYIAQIITIIFGAQFAEAVPIVQDIVEAIGASNFQGIISAVFALGTMIFYWVRDNGKDPVPASQ